MTAISLTFLSACGDVKSVLKGNSDRDSNDGRAVQAAQEMGEFSLTPPPLPPDHPAEFLAVRLLPLKGGKSFEARFAYRGGEPIRIPNLPTGLYEVSVELLGRQGAVIEKGMNRVEIRAGQVATTEIVLRPTGADGAGGLVVVVKRPGDGP